MTDTLHCVVNGRDQLGETPIWCPRTEKIWWIDIEQPKLQCFDQKTGKHDIYPFDATFLGSLALHRNGGFVIALDNTLHHFDPETRALTRLVEVEPADAGTRLNDGRCDRHGRLWIGTMDAAIEQPLGSFYRIDPDGSAVYLFGDIIVTNSIATSPDDSVLYMSDTRRFKIWAFDLDAPTGNIFNRRVFADYTGMKGRPDGACVDAEGYLWNAAFAGGQVIRYAPDGKVDRVIDVPATNPTCVCFGGPELDTLYITTATKFLSVDTLAREQWSGGLLAIKPGVKGLPEGSFG